LQRFGAAAAVVAASTTAVAAAAAVVAASVASAASIGVLVDEEEAWKKIRSPHWDRMKSSGLWEVGKEGRRDRCGGGGGGGQFSPEKITE
jgi:hypothetical protein